MIRREKPVRYKDADRLFYGYFKTIFKVAKGFGSARRKNTK